MMLSWCAPRMTAGSESFWPAMRAMTLRCGKLGCTNWVTVTPGRPLAMPLMTVKSQLADSVPVALWRAVAGARARP